MSPDEARTKALSVLRDGRLRLLSVKTEPNGHLTFVDAIVYGHRGEHVVTFHAYRVGEMGGAWRCSCPDRDGPCPHVFAAELVTHGVMPPGRDGQPKARPERKHKAGAQS